MNLSLVPSALPQESQYVVFAKVVSFSNKVFLKIKSLKKNKVFANTSKPLLQGTHYPAVPHPRRTAPAPAHCGSITSLMQIMAPRALLTAPCGASVEILSHPLMGDIAPSPFGVPGTIILWWVVPKAHRYTPYQTNVLRCLIPFCTEKMEHVNQEAESEQRVKRIRSYANKIYSYVHSCNWINDHELLCS